VRTVRIVLLPILLMSITALFSITGCATDGTGPAESLPEGISQQDLEEILYDATTNYALLNTCKFDMDMDISTRITGGSTPGEMTMHSRISGGMNKSSQQMQMNMEMSMEGTGLGSQDVYAEMYVFPDWTYMRMEVPGMGEQWVKMETTEDLAAALNTQAVDQQMGMLESPLEIEYLRSESVDGFDCYVLSITPNMGELADWLNQQNTGAEDIDWDEMADISNLFKNLSYICYVVKDTNILKKMVMEMEMEYTSEQIGDYYADFDTQSMYIYMDMNLYDQNQPFSVTLPDEAESAEEMPNYMM
jgi:hypothetical protein